MAILGIDHVSTLVKDAEPVVKFYTEQLGFTLATRLERPDMLLITLKRGRDCMEIIQPADVESVKQPGLKHFAFLSDDINADYEAFKAAGVTLLHDQVQVNDNMSFFFMRSPGGEWVEIIQYAQGGC